MGRSRDSLQGSSAQRSLGVGRQQGHLDQPDAGRIHRDPTARQYPILAYDEGRQKMFLFDGPIYAQPIRRRSAPSGNGIPSRRVGPLRDPGDSLDYGYSIFVAYDSIRKTRGLAHDAYDSTPRATTKPGSSTPRGRPSTCVPCKTRRPRATAPRWPSTAGAACGLVRWQRQRQYTDETWEYK
jgi:hypothetical protein